VKSGPALSRFGTVSVRGQMPKRTILLVPTIVASLVAAIAFTAGSAFAEPAADECLSKPNGPSPQGSHWYYRVDRGNNNRHCWYLGREGAKTRQAAAPKQPSSARPKDEALSDNRSEASAGQNPMVTDASTPFSSLAKPAGSPERAPAAMREGNADERTASESQDEMPLVWPVLSAADRAAAEQPVPFAGAQRAPEPTAADRPVESAAAAAASAQPTAKPAHVLAIAAGALLLVAIFFRTIYRLFAVRRHPRPRRNPRDHRRSAANTGRTGEPVAPPLAATMAPERWAETAHDSVAAPHWAGVAREASEAGLIDAVLQRVRSAEASISPARSQSQPSRAAKRRRVAALG
jgi:hypothetical protein